MTTTTRVPRQVLATARPRPQLPKVDWQGLFQEAVYENGQPYAADSDEDDGRGQD